MRSVSNNPIIGWTTAILDFAVYIGGKIFQQYQLSFDHYGVTSKKYNAQNKMSGDMMRFTIGVVCLVAVLLSLAEVSEANYKNAPMNGIMFGKRGPTEYDSRGKTFTALCEIATEACQAWFPSSENK